VEPEIAVIMSMIASILTTGAALSKMVFVFATALVEDGPRENPTIMKDVEHMERLSNSLVLLLKFTSNLYFAKYELGQLIQCCK
jgi:hypothetical protein